MLKRMHPSLARRCLDEAGRSPLSNPVVRYPRWYLQHWHFLPEGYLSRRSAAGYERIIRPFYNACQERRVLETLVQELSQRPPSRVLELGCGPGRALEILSDALPGAELTGLDLSPFMLERAHHRLEQAGADAKLLHASSSAAPTPAGVFDAVIAIHLFGHLPRQAAAAAWAEALRVTAPGGRVYLIDHAWHPRERTPFAPASEKRLLRGVLTFSVLEKRRAG
jgi:ubiquinone/menaquinone biosynthesis C-methylase UbiE